MSFFAPRKILQTGQDLYFTKQLATFFNWIEQTPDAKHGNICIHLPVLQYFCDPNQKHIKDSSNIGFIVCTPGTFYEAWEGISKQTSPSGWGTIFTSPVLEIWEYQANFTTGKIPLRFGLTEIEKEILLRNVRNVITYSLEDMPQVPKLPLTNIPERLLTKATVDVALWVKGRLRGSIILEDSPLINAAKTAGRLATQDRRFKPLNLNELLETTIQITVISNLRLPLLHQELKANQIYSDKCYSAKIQDKKGWFVPAVFNCLTFHNLEQLITTLYNQKLNAPATLQADNIYIGEVDDFIESSQMSSIPLSLRGPVICRDNANIDLTEIAKNATTQLSCIQETDGNIPPIIYPLTNIMEQIDWIRLAHTTWALIAFGLTSNQEISLETGKKSYTYLKKNFYRQGKSLDRYTKILTLLYFNQASYLLKDQKIEEKNSQEIIANLPFLPDEPILQTQLALFLIHKNTDLEKALTISEKIFLDFNNKKAASTNIDLASYVGLITILQKLGQELNRTDLVQATTEVTLWYIKQQLPNGAFPATSKSNFCYTRGTGKILEVLINQPEFNDTSKKRAVKWLGDMQYSEANSYFIPAAVRSNILGGFRHDYLDQSVWIDSSSHLLLAASL